MSPLALNCLLSVANALLTYQNTKRCKSKTATRPHTGKDLLTERWEWKSCVSGPKDGVQVETVGKVSRATACKNLATQCLHGILSDAEFTHCVQSTVRRIRMWSRHKCVFGHARSIPMRDNWSSRSCAITRSHDGMGRSRVPLKLNSLTASTSSLPSFTQWQSEKEQFTSRLWANDSVLPLREKQVPISQH